MPTQIEQLAKKLEEITLEPSRCGTYRMDFKLLAKYVQKMLLEARMQETARYLDKIGSYDEYYIKRTSELRKEVEQCNQ